MSKFTDEQILTAIAQLKEYPSAKVKVSDLAAFLGTSRNYLYTQHKNLLELCKEGNTVKDENNSLLAELIMTQSRLKKTQDDFNTLKDNLDRERKDMKRSTLSDLFFKEAPLYELEQIKKDNENKIAQLNSKIKLIQGLKLKLQNRDSELFNLKEEIKTTGAHAENVKYTFYKPALLLANDAYISNSKLSAWIEKYKDACKEIVLDIINKKFKKVILHVSNFNAKTEDIVKQNYYPEGHYAVVHIALPSKSMRKDLLIKLINENVKLYCIHTKSSNSVAKMFCRKEELPVVDEIIDKLEQQFELPLDDEGFKKVIIEVVNAS